MKGFDKVARKYIVRFVSVYMIFICTIYTGVLGAMSLLPFIPYIVIVFWLAVAGIVLYQRSRRW
jgi:hypothetical protein